MAILKFRVYLEEDEAVYRDVVVKHTQTFEDLHFVVLKAYEFDNKHQATFYRSNDSWLRGREISFAKYEKPYPVEPLIMSATPIGTEIRDTNQKFIYQYDFVKNWIFMLELINVSKEENPRVTYPSVTRVEGIGPQQYGTRSLLGDKFTDIEEKYDLTKNAEGFGLEGIATGETLDADNEDEFGGGEAATGESEEVSDEY
ncbi:hypothetical protein BH11BAC6_BH11BAC6_10350 [soil metagenome]